MPLSKPCTAHAWRRALQLNRQGSRFINQALHGFKSSHRRSGGGVPLASPKPVVHLHDLTPQITRVNRANPTHAHHLRSL